jgi:hypothetical protein
MRLIIASPNSRASSSHRVWKEPINSAPSSMMRPLANLRLLYTRPPMKGRAS